MNVDRFANLLSLMLSTPLICLPASWLRVMEERRIERRTQRGSEKQNCPGNLDVASGNHGSGSGTRARPLVTSHKVYKSLNYLNWPRPPYAIHDIFIATPWRHTAIYFIWPVIIAVMAALSLLACKVKITIADLPKVHVIFRDGPFRAAGGERSCILHADRRDCSAASRSD